MRKLRTFVMIMGVMMITPGCDRSSENSSSNAEDQRRELIIRVPYSPNLDFEKLQYIKSELLSQTAEQVFITGIYSSKLQLFTTERKLDSCHLTRESVFAQLQRNILPYGLLIEWSSKDTIDIAYADCLYPFEREWRLLTGMKILTTDGDSIPLIPTFQLQRAKDERHPIILGQRNEPMLELRITCTNLASEKKLYLLLNRFFGLDPEPTHRPRNVQ